MSPRLKRRSAMVIAGMVGIQMGHKPQDLVAAAWFVADEQSQQLLDAGYPHPTA
ncbi:MAG: hypothetical protein VX290_14865 [Candidatus Latescibacterota bacterium]|nr:hypothetical protein [Candidatus Latescibacterota bacterium]MEE3039467.1 hypothetical protein [Candidatus Latescibacterota bacterium]MEE3264121.1 hypothetical protein [Candidatus Latescibacterota bacterium]